jgi:hypothetical protein
MTGDHMSHQQQQYYFLTKLLSNLKNQIIEVLHNSKIFFLVLRFVSNQVLLYYNAVNLLIRLVLRLIYPRHKCIAAKLIPLQIPMQHKFFTLYFVKYLYTLKDSNTNCISY